MKKYTDEQLRSLLTELLSYPDELPWLEIKHGNDNPDEIGKYISALANSACTENRECGYMIWGVEDGTRIIEGTAFNPDHKNKDQQPLRIYLSRTLKPEIAFEFYSFEVDGKKVVILEVEAAYRRGLFRIYSYRRISYRTQQTSGRGREDIPYCRERLVC